MRDAFGVSTGLLLSGTLAALTFGFTVRFLALSLGACEAGLAKVTGMDAAARSLGLGPRRMLARVHLPIIKTSLLTAAILVFVDGMKELPMTVLLRPFNFETLATHVYRYASHEQFEQSAAGARHRRLRHAAGGPAEQDHPSRAAGPGRVALWACASSTSRMPITAPTWSGEYR